METTIKEYSLNDSNLVELVRNEEHSDYVVRYLVDRKFGHKVFTSLKKTELPELVEHQVHQEHQVQVERMVQTEHQELQVQVEQMVQTVHQVHQEHQVQVVQVRVGHQR
jgi:hypothetical protein